MIICYSRFPLMLGHPVRPNSPRKTIEIAVIRSFWRYEKSISRIKTLKLPYEKFRQLPIAMQNKPDFLLFESWFVRNGVLGLKLKTDIFLQNCI